MVCRRSSFCNTCARTARAVRIFWTIALIVLLALQTAGLARSQETPVMGSTATVGEGLALEDGDQLVHILAVGDAVGGGLGAGLLRMGEIDGRYEVAIRFNEESGLSRPEIYDWPATLSKILETNTYDVIVVLMGVNDRQTIRDGNARYNFGSPDWIAAYTKQVDRMLDVLKASGAKVYWVSIPPMADPGYDEAMRFISNLQKERVEARGAAYVDVRPVLLTPDGQYKDSGPDENGDVRKLRGRDGISFFKLGNNVMGQEVLRALQSKAVADMKTAAAAPQTRAQVTRRVRPPREPRVVPIFGRLDIEGNDIAMRPEDVAVGAALMLSAGGEGLAPDKAMAMLVSIAPPDSAARRLFSEGAAGDVPKGRADDFSVPPEAQP